MSSSSDTSTHFAVTIGPLGATLLVAPDESESGVAVVEHTLEPGALGAPLHRHANEDELSLVTAGELTARRGESVVTAGPGDVVVKPRGEWHTFWNAGTEPVRFFEVVAPGAFVDYFEAVAGELSDPEPDPETMARVASIAEEYGLEMDPGSVPDLLERHDLRM